MGLVANSPRQQSLGFEMSLIQKRAQSIPGAVVIDDLDDLVDRLQFSDEYAEFIMDHHDDNRVRIICNGDTLLQAQEDLYLFAEFMMHREKINAGSSI